MDTKKLRLALERLGPMTVVFSRATGTDAPSQAIEPLVQLFFRAAEAAFRRENGRAHHDDDEYLTWMFATRFHLPPTVRWFGVLETTAPESPDLQSYEFWMAMGDRLKAEDPVDTKPVGGGLYASIECPFEPATLGEHWRILTNRVQEAGLEVAPRRRLEWHVQAPNCGGFHRFRLMLPVQEDSLPIGLRGV